MEHFIRLNATETAAVVFCLSSRARILEAAIISEEATRTSAEGTLELPGLVVTPAWVVERLQHPALRLLDVRPRESYDEGHIPGAVQFDLELINREVDGVAGMLAPAAEFADLMGRSGIGPDTPVVVYDDNWGLPASRVLWALTRYGHRQVALLTGGIDRWQEEDHPVSVDAVSPMPASFDVHPTEHYVATREWLQAQLGRPDVVLLDTRAPGEFNAGHLPGAVCWDWINGVPMDSWDALRPAEELREELAQLGVRPEKEIVTYCRSGARAAHTYLLLRHLGFARVRLYDGSWLEWSRYHEEKEFSNDDKR